MPIILLHGLMGGLSNFSAVIKFFKNKGYRVLMPSLPIYDMPIMKSSIKSLAEFLYEFIKYKGFKNYIYPYFYDELITEYKNLFEKFQSTHIDLDENTAYNNFINNLELFNNEKEILLQNIKYFL